MANSRDTATRAKTRILCFYDLSGRIPATGGEKPLVDVFEFGRFESHVQANQEILPSVLLAERLDPAELGFASGLDFAFASCRVAVVTTPFADATLALDLVVEGECDPSGAAKALAVTCFDRGELTYAGQPLLRWLSTRLGAGTVEFGRNVHQILCPGGPLLEQVLTAGHGDADTVPPIIKEIVYRATLSGTSDSRLAVRTPAGLNNRGSTLVAHGRGVSLVAGWAEHVENCFGLIAGVLQSSLAVLQRTRRLAFETLAVNRRASVSTPSQSRDLIGTLSQSLNEGQLGLVFGVEAYVDSLLIPEIIVEGYQTSLRDSMGINLALENSSRMMQRLTSVIDARAAALDAALAERDEKRERSFSALIAVTTLIALPPALLLAYFGVNSIDVDDDRSILDLGYYWPAYLLAWCPFVILVAVGYLLRRRSRVRLASRPRLLPRQRKDDGDDTAGHIGAPGQDVGVVPGRP